MNQTKNETNNKLKHIKINQMKMKQQTNLNRQNMKQRKRKTTNNMKHRTT